MALYGLKVRVSMVSGVENIIVAIRSHSDHLLNIGLSKVVLQFVEYRLPNQQGNLFAGIFTFL